MALAGDMEARTHAHAHLEPMTFGGSKIFNLENEG